MSARDEEWWEQQAGELVLGTLDDHEKDLFESIRNRDPEFQRRVTRWQEKLAPLDQSIVAVQPAEHVWESIESRLGFTVSTADFSKSILDQTTALEKVQDAFSLDDLTSSADQSASQAASQVACPVGSTANSECSTGLPVSNANSNSIPDTVSEQESSQQITSAQADSVPQPVIRKVNIWRDMALLATIACVILSAIAWNAALEKVDEKSGLPATGTGFQRYDGISVVVNEQSDAVWVVHAVTGLKQLHVSVVGSPEPDTSQSYQLWMVKAGDAGVSSMGLLPVETGKTVALDTPRFSSDAVAFSVSIEPKAGAPRDMPTGPVLFQGSFQLLEW